MTRDYSPPGTLPSGPLRRVTVGFGASSPPSAAARSPPHYRAMSAAGPCGDQDPYPHMGSNGGSQPEMSHSPHRGSYREPIWTMTLPSSTDTS
jgi:hypothetical protein